MNTTHLPSIAFAQKRRFYTVLPLLICPFLLVTFWLLGGGSAVAAGTPTTRTVGGLNLTLPAAKLKDVSRLTKMDYYRQADQDSAKRHTLVKNDPYYRLPGISRPADNTYGMAPMTTSKAIATSTRLFPMIPRLHDSDRNEALVYRKLAALNRALEVRAPVSPPPAIPPVATAPSSPEVRQLEHLVQTLHARDTTMDPDLQQLGGLLDKIAAIQHPARMPEPDLPATSTPDLSPARLSTSFSVTALPDTVAACPEAMPDSAAETDTDQNGFYASDDPQPDGPVSGSIPAVIDETVTVAGGSTVPFRLLEDVRINTQMISTGSLVYGIVQLNGERLTVTIKSIQYRGNIFPVSLVVYSPDGLPGIPAPVSLTRDVAKQSADASVQSMGLASFDQSIGAQATAAGIQAAKTLLSKKVRLITVTLSAGYQVFLKDNASH